MSFVNLLSTAIISCASLSFHWHDTISHNTISLSLPSPRPDLWTLCWCHRSFSEQSCGHYRASILGCTAIQLGYMLCLPCTRHSSTLPVTHCVHSLNRDRKWGSVSTPPCTLTVTRVPCAWRCLDVPTSDSIFWRLLALGHFGSLSGTAGWPGLFLFDTCLPIMTWAFYWFFPDSQELGPKSLASHSVPTSLGSLHKFHYQSAIKLWYGIDHTPPSPSLALSNTSLINLQSDQYQPDLPESIPWPSCIDHSLWTAASWNFQLIWQWLSES